MNDPYYRTQRNLAIMCLVMAIFNIGFFLFFSASGFHLFLAFILFVCVYFCAPTPKTGTEDKPPQD